MSDEINYRGAQFYKCALQVNPYSYAKTYQGEAATDEQTYNQGILAGCKKNHIVVVGIADHGNVDDSEGLRQCLQEAGITVFPGFEIASSEKIHMVCLYPENTPLANLNQYLGQLMDNSAEKPTDPSSLSCEQIAEKVLNNQEGFWFAAHMTGKNGLLRLSGAGDNYVHLWKKDELVIAGQIPGKVEGMDTGNESLKKYVDIIKEKNPHYARKKPIAIINAKDVRIPQDLENKSASCRIKMTEPNFDAFKLAFSDPESRIRLNHDVSEKPYSVINSIEWQGAGFFEQERLDFSKNLNVVIGGRGTGKTTLLESIRYALDLPIIEKDIKGLDALRKNTLANSQVILDVYSKAQQGNRYTISRRYGESPVVKNSQGVVSRLTATEILPKIQLFGQVGIWAIEEDESAKLDLIKHFLPDSAQFDERIAKIKRELAKNRKRWIEANDEFDLLDVEVSKEHKLKERVKQLTQLGVESKLKNVALLEKEKSIRIGIDEQFDLIERWLNDYQSVFDLDFLKDSSLENLIHKDIITEYRRVFEGLQKELNSVVASARSQLMEAKGKHETALSTWNAKSDDIIKQLNSVIAQLPEQAGKTGKELGADFKSIIESLELIGKQKTIHIKQKEIINQIESERNNLLEEYRNNAFDRFSAMGETAKKMNKKKLKGKVKISVKRCGGRESLRDFLKSIEGIGPAKIQWLDSHDEALDLVEWSRWIKENNKGAFMEKFSVAGLTTTTAEKLVGMGLTKRLELEEIELKDQVDIELNVAHQDNDAQYEPLDKLSTGQKCTAILNLLLLSCDDPLIIDQPEDHLDNAFIAERIVKDLRKLKTNRQFLFSTHNANIPVFGDAEMIAVLDSRKGVGTIKDIGSIDKPEIQNHAANILEGGKVAFNIRKKKYGF